MHNVHIVQYLWAGSWGPFSIKVPCGECGLTEGIIHDVIEKEFVGMPVTFETKEWLPNWWRIVHTGAWHAPIVMVNGTVVSQGTVVDRGLLAAAIRTALDPQDEPTGSTVFYKEGCQFCTRAKALLDEKGIAYEKHDVVQDPLEARRMFSIVKKHIGPKTPVTVPQIWLDGKYIGGTEHLERHLGAQKSSSNTVYAV